jgi:hypothetical protein
MRRGGLSLPFLLLLFCGIAHFITFNLLIFGYLNRRVLIAPDALVRMIKCPSPLPSPLHPMEKRWALVVQPRFGYFAKKRNSDFLMITTKSSSPEPYSTHTRVFFT